MPETFRGLSIDHLKIECCNNCACPLLLLSVGTEEEERVPDPGLMELGKRLGLPVAFVTFTLADTPNPADPRFLDISAFEVQELWPQSRPPINMTPQKHAKWLWSFHERHVCPGGSASTQ